ncbi:MAG: hypothetical protein C4324_09020 [Blastocatellia bacterium]
MHFGTDSPAARLIQKDLRNCSLSGVCVALFLVLVGFFSAAKAQPAFEGREISSVQILFAGAENDPTATDEFLLIAKTAVGRNYSAVAIRRAIESLYTTGMISSIEVQAATDSAGKLNLIFLVKKKSRTARIDIDLRKTKNSALTEQQILLRLNLLDPGAYVSEQALEANADLILEYLRDQGFFQGRVSYEIKPISSDSDVAVKFIVEPGEQARIADFSIEIVGTDNETIASSINLKKGDRYTRDKIADETKRIREALRKQDFIAPQINDPRIVYDRDTNSIAVSITGKAGPKIAVEVEAEKINVGSRTRSKLLPVIREGTLEYAAIIEGERRLENYFQEQGYFFANATAVCSVTPPSKTDNGPEFQNGTRLLCSALSGADLFGKNVTVIYKVNLDRRLKLTELRLRGTNLFTIEEIRPVLESQPANILGIVPLFGYGRGYTNGVLLDEDAETIRSLLRELGYRDATVRVSQGVSPDGENLIITFIVDEGPPTIISDVQIVGNSAISEAEIRRQFSPLVGRNYSRALVRNVRRKIVEYYASKGYFDSSVSIKLDEAEVKENDAPRTVKITFQIDNEGKRVFINRVLIAGAEMTKEEAIRKALTLRSGEMLRAADIYSSEQNLYASDAFSRVETKTRPAGERPDGSLLRDVIINVEEQAPRIVTYGGGFSTDLGFSGFVDLRHLNLFGRLWQAGARLRYSQRQQLFQLDFVNPRFVRDGQKSFAPLTISAAYQRDETVTRFFRSAFDRGTFGIVQRRDASGVPIDLFGLPAGNPTLNRLTLTAETNRTLSVRSRSLIFFRYRFEDVRIFKIGSLLIKDLLLPDSKIRISGFGITYVRDTRRRCTKRDSILEIINRGESDNPCKYNAADATAGSYITAEYNFSLPTFGANVGFNKFQASYNKYYTMSGLNNTTLAARVLMGMANVFSGGNRFAGSSFPSLGDVLPISERFFAGGANTLRGFDFETAGPRVAIVPQGKFFTSAGQQVFLEPFTVPFGGNGLAVVNLEARIPMRKNLRVVPFYDGGNVFRSIKDIFKSPNVAPGDIVGQNLRARWTNTVGLGLRLKTPIGSDIGIDYGYLLNPPRFIIPQPAPPDAFYRLHQGQIHFRFSQAF